MQLLCMMSFRMPGERLSIRDNAAVGRFHGAAESNGRAVPERRTVTKVKKEESGCRRWLRKACPCCCRQRSNSYDFTNEEDGGVVDGVEEVPVSPVPPSGDTELDGESQTIRKKIIRSSSNSIFFPIFSHQCYL